MKLIAIVLLMTVLGCTASTQNESRDEPQPNLVCGVKYPTQDLPWLKEIIKKAEEDKATGTYKGNYLGKIYLESFKGQPIFLVEMMMGSGGLGGYLFRCDGQRVFPTEEETLMLFNSIQKKNMVYTNFP